MELTNSKGEEMKTKIISDQLNEISMQMVLHVGNAREKVNLALDYALDQNYQEAYKIFYSACQDIDYACELEQTKFNYHFKQAKVSDNNFYDAVKNMLKAVQTDYQNVGKIIPFLEKSESY